MVNLPFTVWNDKFTVWKNKYEHKMTNLLLSVVLDLEKNTKQ